MNRFLWAIGFVGLSAQVVWPHYNMLLPSSALVQKGDKVVFVYQFGHPFEHELFDAPPPAKVEVTTPDGKTHELTKTLEKFKKPGGDGKDVTAYRFNFTPEQRGDHWVVLATPPIWFAESEDFVQDQVQVMLHVQTQNGWEKTPGEQLRMAPLTRPYGLLPGMAFQAQVLPLGLPGNVVEIERYNERKPKVIPADELVTFKARTDPNGVFTCTLPESGWWCMTAQRPAGQMARDGKEYPVRQRVTLWVHVGK
jgi:cobalt/nickel transport protein